jgi:hypothetical protein
MTVLIIGILMFILVTYMFLVDPNPLYFLIVAGIVAIEVMHYVH